MKKKHIVIAALSGIVVGIAGIIAVAGLIERSKKGTLDDYTPDEDEEDFDSGVDEYDEEDSDEDGEFGKSFDAGSASKDESSTTAGEHPSEEAAE